MCQHIPIIIHPSTNPPTPAILLSQPLTLCVNIVMSNHTPTPHHPSHQTQHITTHTPTINQINAAAILIPPPTSSPSHSTSHSSMYLGLMLDEEWRPCDVMTTLTVMCHGWKYEIEIENERMDGMRSGTNPSTPCNTNTSHPIPSSHPIPLVHITSLRQQRPNTTHIAILGSVVNTTHSKFPNMVWFFPLKINMGSGFREGRRGWICV